MKRHIAELSEHYIVSGFGRMGREVAADLARQHLPFVVVDEIEESVERAKSLTTVSDDDRKNLIVVVLALGLNPQLNIVARASAEDVTAKLVRAGADSIFLPYRTGGRRIASDASSPCGCELL